MKSRLFMSLFMGCVFLMSWCWAEDRTLPLPDPGNVTLTLDEYNRLLALAAKPPKKPDVAPLSYSIQHADVKLRVENNGVVGSVELEGEVFHKGISKVPLTSGMTILEARQNGKGVPLIQEAGTHVAFLPAGDFSIALDTGLPLKIEAGRASFSLPAPVAGSVQMSLVIPGEHTLANITPGVITSRRSENGHTVIEATLVPGQPATVWWATREVVAPVVPREARFLADTKTLVSISEAEMRIAVLADVTMVTGEMNLFEVQIPEGFEVTGVIGPTLDSAETPPRVVNPAGSGESAPRYLSLHVLNPGARSHQFLISMERSVLGTQADAPFISFKGAQRETGEVLVEGTCTMEITATEAGGLKRMDVKEANPYLRVLAHFPPQAAFRYHRQLSETPTLALNWVRFPDGSVLAAVAESADVTTMVTSEGKSLTEVKLTVKNQAQPFLKVSLPSGATILSAEVAGEPVKPVQGADGNRVPLLRPGFRPNGPYLVSFVFLHSGAPFAKKGGADLSLPSMDIPISLLNWEVFLPERYRVKDSGGDVIAANRVPEPFREDVEVRDRIPQPAASPSNLRMQVLPGQIGGYVTDPTGAVIANAQITITSYDGSFSRTAMSDAAGRWLLVGLPSGNYKAMAERTGFKTVVYNLNYNPSQPAVYDFSLGVGTTAETVEVVAQAPTVDATTSMSMMPRPQKLAPGAVGQNASENVMNLQKRV